MKWTHQYELGSPRMEMNMDRDAMLDDVLVSFAGFLRAVGYCFDGHLEIVNEEEATKEESI